MINILSCAGRWLAGRLSLLFMLIALMPGSMTAVAIAANGSRTAFGGNTLSVARATYQVGLGSHAEPTVFISGAGSNITLPETQS